MLHLAQVTKKDLGGKVELRLLAQQKAEYAWATLTDDADRLWVDAASYHEGMLLLVELSSKRQVQRIHDATPWILEVIDDFLAAGINPASLREEVQRAEQWRQSLTLQSQELGRRTLEMEARREQIQDLEEKLKQEKQDLDLKEARLKKLEEFLEQEKQQLDQAKANSNGTIDV